MSSYKPLQVYNEKNEWFVYDKNNKKNTFKSKEKADYFVRTYYADEFKGKRIDRKKVYTPKQIETLEKSDAKVDSISTAQGIDPGPEIQPDPKTDPQPDYTPNIEVNGEEFTKQNWTDAKQSLLNEGNALFDEYDKIKFELESKQHLFTDEELEEKKQQLDQLETQIQENQNNLILTGTIDIGQSTSKPTNKNSILLEGIENRPENAWKYLGWKFLSGSASTGISMGRGLQTLTSTKVYDGTEEVEMYPGGPMTTRPKYRDGTTEEIINSVLYRYGDAVATYFADLSEGGGFDYLDDHQLDPEKSWLGWTGGLVESAPNLLAMYGTSALTLAVTKSPTTAMGVGMSFSYGLEGGSAYETFINSDTYANGNLTEADAIRDSFTSRQFN
jgi:hypothetical protein